MLAAGSIFPISISAADQPQTLISVPSEFLFYLNLPGQSDRFLRPGKIFCDRRAAEVYVVDAGHNRVTLFDESGTYRFEFSLAGYCGSATDLVVSHDGLIYILGTTSDGRQVLRFDFDGKYLGPLEVPENAELDLSAVSALGIDAQGRLYLQDQRGLRIVRLAVSSDLDFSIALAAQLDDKGRKELVMGPLTVAGEDIYLPMSSLGTVYRYSLDGNYLGSIGRPGTTTGSLAFPVSVAVTDDGLVLVLDKQRFNVQAYTIEGEFLGEFGGKGTTPGWFYFPSRVEVDSQRQIYVGQIFQNRVQACRLPRAIDESFQRTTTPVDDDQTPQLGRERGDLSEDELHKISNSSQNQVEPEIVSGSASTLHNMMEVYNA